MDLNLLYAILIALAPVVLAIIFTKIYNIIHGVISFLFFGAVLMLCVTIFGDKIPALGEFGGFYAAFTVTMCELISGPVKSVLGDLLVKNPNLLFYVYFAVVALVFLISQIISSCIFRRRSRKRKNLLRQAKRY